MKHIRSSSNRNLFLLENNGNPNLNITPLLTDFNETIENGSLCIDRVNNILYILKSGVWNEVGTTLNGILIEDNTSTSILMPDFSSTNSFGAIINSPGSSVTSGVVNSVIIGGKDIVATENNTAYVNQISFFNSYSTSGAYSDGILKTLLTSDRTWELPDKSGRIALIDDLSSIIDLFGTSSIISIPTFYDKDIPTVACSSDNTLVTLYPISRTPTTNSYVSVFLNGQELEVGNGIKTKPFYFSNDGGASAKTFTDDNPILMGDRLYCNPSILGYDIEEGWRLALHYNILGSCSSSSGVVNLVDLQDVNISYPILNGQILQYNSTSGFWENTDIDGFANINGSNINADNFSDNLHDYVALIYDTKLDVNGLNSEYSFVYCKETGKNYKYVSDGTDFVIDNDFILATGDGGDSRFISLIQEQNYKIFVVHNQTELLEAAAEINATSNAGEIIFANNITLSSDIQIDLEGIKVNLSNFILYFNNHIIKINGENFYIEQGTFRRDDGSVSYNDIVTDSYECLYILGNASNIASVMSVLVTGYLKNITFYNFVGTNNQDINQVRIASKSGPSGRITFDGCQVVSYTGNQDFPPYTRTPTIEDVPLRIQSNITTSQNIYFISMNYVYHMSGNISRCVYVNTNISSEGNYITTDGTVIIKNTNIETNKNIKPTGGKVSIFDLTSVSGIIDIKDVIPDVSKTILLASNGTDGQLYKVGLDSILGLVDDYTTAGLVNQTTFDSATSGLWTAIDNINVDVQNGLNNTSGFIEIGGELYKNTSINANVNEFIIYDASKILLEAIDTTTGRTTSIIINPTSVEANATYDQEQSMMASSFDEVILINQKNSEDTIISVSNGQIVASSDVAGFEGIKYDIDYSPNFSPLSLVNKSYVTAAINNAITASLTASNGLTKTGTNIELGGVLTKHTIINAASYKFQVNGAGQKTLESMDASSDSYFDVSPTRSVMYSENLIDEDFSNLLVTSNQIALEHIDTDGDSTILEIGAKILSLESTSPTFAPTIINNGVISTIGRKRVFDNQVFVANIPLVITHGMETEDIIVVVRDKNDSLRLIIVDDVPNSLNQVTLTSNIAIASAKIIIIG